jgi:hypothetical protein
MTLRPKAPYHSYSLAWWCWCRTQRKDWGTVSHVGNGVGKSRLACETSRLMGLIKPHHDSLSVPPGRFVISAEFLTLFLTTNQMGRAEKKVSKPAEDDAGRSLTRSVHRSANTAPGYSLEQSISLDTAEHVRAYMAYPSDVWTDPNQIPEKRHISVVYATGHSRGQMSEQCTRSPAQKRSHLPRKATNVVVSACDVLA